MDHKTASDLTKKLIAAWDAPDRNSLHIVLEIYKYAPREKVHNIAKALFEKDEYLTRYTRVMVMLGAEGFTDGSQDSE